MRFPKSFTAIIFFLLLSCTVTAQDPWNMIRGSWIRYKLERQDGSAAIGRTVSDSAYYNCVISKSDVTFYNDPVEKYFATPWPYLFKDPEIIFAKKNRMLIERLSPDTLIVLEVSKRSDEFAVRQYFVREQVILQNCFRNLVGQESFTATKYCAPSLKKPIHYNIPWTFKKTQTNFILKGTIALNLLDRSASTSFENPEVTTPDILNQIKKVFDKSFAFWTIDRFAHFKEVLVPFSIRSINETTSKKIIVEYVTNESMSGPEDYRRESLKQKTGVDLYNHAVDAYMVKDYEKAAEWYLKSYEADPYNLEAVYLAAEIYRQLGKIEKACETWKLLADRKQVKAQDLISHHCVSGN